MDLQNPVSAPSTATDSQAKTSSLDIDEDNDDDEYSEFDVGEEEDTDDKNDEEMTVEEAFEVLSGGRKTVSKAQLLKWDVVDELMEAGQLTEQELTDFFDRAGAKGRNTLTMDGFEALLDLLSPLTDVFEEDVEDLDSGAVLGAHRDSSLSDVPRLFLHL